MRDHDARVARISTEHAAWVSTASEGKHHRLDRGESRAEARTDAAADGHAEHDKHTGHSVEMFRRKFLGTLLLSVPTVVWAPMIQHWLGYEAWGGPVVSRWISALFGTLVFVYGGWVFIKGGQIRPSKTSRSFIARLSVMPVTDAQWARTEGLARQAG